MVNILNFEQRGNTQLFLLTQIHVTIQPSQQTVQTPTNTRILVNTKTVFTITLIVGTLTMVSTWLFGMPLQRTLLENTLLSTSIFSLAFFLFISIGLFKGIKLKDNIGNLAGRLKPPAMRNITDAASNADFMLVGDGIPGILLSAVLWVLITVVIGLCLWLFSAVL